MKNFELKIVKTFEEVVECPYCNYRNRDLWIDENGKHCFRCGNVIEDPNWKKMEFKGIICDKCGQIVLVVPDNMLPHPHLEVLYCLNCKDNDMFHIIAIKYRRKWRHPNEFLFYKGREGLVKVSSLRDRITLFVLWHLAKKEASEFLSIDTVIDNKLFHAKILWKQGETIGYYAYTTEENSLPILQQIFVRKEYRRRGYATQMVQNFLDTFKGPVGIESPNEHSLKLLEKMGLVKRTKKAYKPTGRVYFVRRGW